jgi:8-oxo-dGTP pyrophosphatase MutT (NUDIX family)
LSQTSNPFDRLNFTPGHCVGSAIIVSPRAELLLLHHQKLKRWLQPGGHGDPGEVSALQIAQREALEETGILLNAKEGKLFDLDLQQIPAHGAEPAHLHFDLRYLFILSEEQQIATTEAHQVRWFNNQELGDIMSDSGMERVVTKLRANGLVL